MLSVRGDFNDDQLINALDVDLLAADLAAQSHSAAFDLTGDARVDQQDLEYWVVDLYGTLFGDADLNRRVDRGDLARLTRGYGHSARASWADGNFNADDGVGLFDLRLLQANFGRTGPGHTTVDDVVTMVAGGLDRLDQSLPDLVSELNFDLGGPGQGAACRSPGTIWPNCWG